jgi:hypothetical protein
MREAVAAVAGTANAVAEHASESSSIAEMTERQARQGSDVTAAVSSDMQDAVATATESLQLIGDLSERIAEVGILAGTIDTVATRTKLVALNASIEAARAGENGRSVSVVASAVGDLAASTAEAATTIGRIVAAIQETRTNSSASSEAIRQSTERMAEGIARASRAGEAFAMIVSEIERLNAIIDEVADASGRQASAAADLEISATAITGAASSAVRSGEQLAQAIDGVRRVVERLGRATIATTGDQRARTSAHALESIALAVSPFFELVSRHAGRFHATYEQAIAREGRMRQEDLASLDAPLHAALELFGDSMLGIGLAAAPGLLADRPLWMQWWFNGAGGPEFSETCLDRDSPDFYDYPSLPWFCDAVRRREPCAIGPYFDRGAMNTHVLTLAAPVIVGELVIGVAAADLRVDQIDELCRAHLAVLGQPALVIGGNGRALASTDHRWCAPGSAPDPQIAARCELALSAWTVFEDGSTLARTPTPPWALFALNLVGAGLIAKVQAAA